MLELPGTTGEERGSGNGPPATSRGRLLHWAAGLSIGALVAHGIDAPDHLNEWWGYATFFVLVAAIQFFYGIVLFIQPWRYDEDGGVRGDADRLGRPYYVLGAILNACAIIIYAVSRTVGIPMLGPEAAAEPVTALSLAPVAVEVATTYCLVMLMWRLRVRPSQHGETV